MTNTKVWQIWQVAEMLELPVSTIKKWVKEGKIETVLLAPNKIHISASEVERLIARARVPARDAGASTLDLNERLGIRYVNDQYSQ